MLSLTGTPCDSTVGEKEGDNSSTEAGTTALAQGRIQQVDDGSSQPLSMVGVYSSLITGAGEIIRCTTAIMTCCWNWLKAPVKLHQKVLISNMLSKDHFVK